MNILVEKLFKDLKIDLPEIAFDKSYLLKINEDLEIKIFDLDPGFYFHSDLIYLKEEEKKEDLFIYLMKANLLGQGTGKGSIGIDKDENLLTLAYDIPYEVNYVKFKEKLEDFVNYAIYWKKEIARFIRLANQTIL